MDSRFQAYELEITNLGSKVEEMEKKIHQQLQHAEMGQKILMDRIAMQNVAQQKMQEIQQVNQQIGRENAELLKRQASQVRERKRVDVEAEEYEIAMQILQEERKMLNGLDERVNKEMSHCKESRIEEEKKREKLEDERKEIKIAHEYLNYELQRRVDQKERIDKEVQELRLAIRKTKETLMTERGQKQQLKHQVEKREAMVKKLNSKVKFITGPNPTLLRMREIYQKKKEELNEVERKAQGLEQEKDRKAKESYEWRIMMKAKIESLKQEKELLLKRIEGLSLRYVLGKKDAIDDLVRLRDELVERVSKLKEGQAQRRKEIEKLKSIKELGQKLKLETKDIIKRARADIEAFIEKEINKYKLTEAEQQEIEEMRKEEEEHKEYGKRKNNQTVVFDLKDEWICGGLRPNPANIIDSVEKDEDYQFQLFQITQSRGIKKFKPVFREKEGKRAKFKGKKKNKKKTPFYKGNDSIADIVEAPDLKML